MVGPERGRGIKGHALGDVVVGGGVVVVVGHRWRHGECWESGDGDHGGGGHHGVEDERQAVCHVPVGGTREGWGVACRGKGCQTVKVLDTAGGNLLSEQFTFILKPWNHKWNQRCQQRKQKEEEKKMLLCPIFQG